MQLNVVLVDDHVSILFIDLFCSTLLSSGFASNAQSHDSWKIDLPGGGFIEKPGSEPRTTHNLSTSRSAQSSEFKTPDVSVNLNLNQSVKYYQYFSIK